MDSYTTNYVLRTSQEVIYCRTIAAAAIRLQRVGAIRSPETGLGRGMGGEERTVFFDNSNSMLVR